MIDQELALPYVGALAEDARLVLACGEETVGHFAARLRQQHHAQRAKGGNPIFGKQTILYKGERESYYS